MDFGRFRRFLITFLTGRTALAETENMEEHNGISGGAVEETLSAEESLSAGEPLQAGESEPMSESELQVTVQMTTGALYDYMIRHAYTGASGILGTCFGFLGILVFAKTGGWLYLIMGIVLILYLPVVLAKNAAFQMKLNPVYKKPLVYDFSAEGIRVTQGETSQSLRWEQCTKAVSTGKSILLYTGKNNASIFPRKDLGTDAGALIAVLAKYLEPNKMKIRF